MQPLTDPLPPGTILGTHKILSVLGQGGFGITYVAWDTILHRNVALKECCPRGLCYREKTTGKLIPVSDAALPLMEAALLDMRKEAQTIASLDHPAITRIHDIFQANGTLYFSMPWLEGGSLRERIRQHDFSPVEAQGWLEQVSEGLAYLHQHHIYHRDIKAENILFDSEGRPILVDFGAAFVRSEVSTTITQGEFSYATAPAEQIVGSKEIGPWTDLYALAATWYELIVGTLPPRADKRLLHDDYRPLADNRDPAGWNRSLLTAIDRNLSMDWHKRSRDAEAFLQMLRAAPQRRIAKTLTVSALSLMVAAVLTGGSLWILQERAQESAPAAPAPSCKPTQEQTLYAVAELQATAHELQALLEQARNEPTDSPVRRYVIPAMLDKWETMMRQTDSPREAHTLNAALSDTIEGLRALIFPAEGI